MIPGSRSGECNGGKEIQLWMQDQVRFQRLVLRFWGPSKKLYKGVSKDEVWELLSAGCLNFRVVKVWVQNKILQVPLAMVSKAPGKGVLGLIRLYLAKLVEACTKLVTVALAGLRSRPERVKGISMKYLTQMNSHVKLYTVIYSLRTVPWRFLIPPRADPAPSPCFFLIFFFLIFWLWCGMQNLSSQPGIESMAPVVESWSSNSCTIRKAPAPLITLNNWHWYLLAPPEEYEKYVFIRLG